MEVLIELDKASLHFQNYHAIRELSMCIPNGRTTIILGPSGSGKSSLLKLASGLVAADEGRVTIMGRDYNDMSTREQQLFRGGAGFIFQNGALWMNQTVYNNLYIPLSYHLPGLSRIEASAMIDAALKQVGYDEASDLRPSSLSAGEQKAVAFARSLILSPHLLFMDEPTSFIDETGAKRIVSLLESLQEQHKTMVAVSNYYSLAFRLADYLCIINKGRLYCMDRIEEVVRAWPDFMVPIESKHRKILERRFGERIMKGENEE